MTDKPRSIADKRIGQPGVQMRITWLVLLTIPAILLVRAQTQPRLVQWLDKQYEAMRQDLVRVLVQRGSAQRGKSLRVTSQYFNNKFQEPVAEDIPFPCDTAPGSPGARSATRPTSVHRIRPGDIDVIAAMGDSLTAGTATTATDLAGLLIENRGMSWSGGGESTWREYLTLPNILKKFNPSLIGYALTDSLGFQNSSQFNVGEPFAIASDMSFQAEILVKRMRSDKRVDYENDWKMVTIMVGPNDFCCHMCYLQNFSVTPQLEKNGLTKALDYLRDNMPRTIVNLVAPPQLKKIKEYTGKPIICSLVNKIECPCLFGSRWEYLKENFAQIIREVQEIELQLAMSSQYNSNDNFAVVGHPFLVDASIPSKKTARGEFTDFSFLAVDCFHFSQKTHASVANLLWNSLLEPVGNKSSAETVPLPLTRFLCPTAEHPFIYTVNNSVT